MEHPAGGGGLACSSAPPGTCLAAGTSSTARLLAVRSPSHPPARPLPPNPRDRLRAAPGRKSDSCRRLAVGRITPPGCPRDVSIGTGRGLALAVRTSLDFSRGRRRCRPYAQVTMRSPLAFLSRPAAPASSERAAVLIRHGLDPDDPHSHAVAQSRGIVARYPPGPTPTTTHTTRRRGTS